MLRLRSSTRHGLSSAATIGKLCGSLFPRTQMMAFTETLFAGVSEAFTTQYLYQASLYAHLQGISSLRIWAWFARLGSSFVPFGCVFFCNLPRNAIEPGISFIGKAAGLKSPSLLYSHINSFLILLLPKLMGYRKFFSLFLRLIKKVHYTV